MITIGLTGSIAMGKTATAQMFRDAGIPVYDADAEVHALYQAGGAAVEPIQSAFGDVLDDAGGIDRTKLRSKVIDSADEMARLEAIVHPLTAKSRQAFYQEHDSRGQDVVVVDIPLLFETGGDKSVDYVIVVSAPYEVQRERVLAREGMTEDLFQAILNRQMPDSEKRARADFIIDTSQGFDFARSQVDEILRTVRKLDSEAD